MKMRGILIVAAGITALIALAGCELALEDGEIYSYTGWNSSIYDISPAELTINNSTNGSDIITAYLLQTGNFNTLSDDLLGSHIIKSLRSNTIRGVPKELAARVRLSFGSPASRDVIYGSVATPLNFAANDYLITVTIDPDGWEIRSIAPNPNIDVIQQDGYTIIVEKRPR